MQRRQIPVLTALKLVEESHRVKSGDWVLMHAAAGGVQVQMIQILKGLRAKLNAAAGSPEKVLSKVLEQTMSLTTAAWRARIGS